MRAENGSGRSGEAERDRGQCRHGAIVGWGTYGGHRGVVTNEQGDHNRRRDVKPLVLKVERRDWLDALELLDWKREAVDIHLSQRACNLEGVGYCRDALRGVDAFAFPVEAAQLVARQIELRGDT